MNGPRTNCALDRIGENQAAGRQHDVSLRRPVTIWRVVVGSLYIRSVRGVAGGRCQGVIRHQGGAISWGGTTREVTFTPDGIADDAVDAGYFAKYGHGSPSQSITNATARVTTMRVEPRP